MNARKIFFLPLEEMTYDNDPSHAPTQQELDQLPDRSMPVPLSKERESATPRRTPPQQPMGIQEEAEDDRTEMYVMMAGIATVWLSLFLF